LIEMNRTLVLALVCGCAATTPPPPPVTSPAPVTAPAAAAEAKATYDKAYKLAMAGDLTGAQPLFRKATELDPQLAIAWFDLGGVTEQLGDAPGALKALEQCVAVSPSFVEARAELGTLYREQQQLDRAVEQFRGALTVTEPVTDERFTLKYSRGHALHNLAATYVDMHFPAAAAGIAASLLNDPEAEDNDLDRLIDHTSAMIDPKPSPAKAAQLAAFLRDATAATTPPEALATIDRYQALVHELDADTAERVDRWQVLRIAAKLDEVANRLEPADALLVRANDLARGLPLKSWLEGTYEQIGLRVRLGKLEPALHDFDELAWIEAVAQFARADGGQHYSHLARVDPALAGLRAKPQFAATVKRYRVPG
jgi:hypothetical protein